MTRTTTTSARIKIKISENGEVTFSTKSAAKEKSPTEEEASAIKKLSFPKTIAARTTEGLPHKGSKDDLFVCLDSEGMIPFVQQRVEHDDGTKSYLPWVFLSDGSWASMEPDDGLPLYGQEHLKDAHRIYIHEGAKAARAAQQIADDHPWAAELRRGVHLGWLGGAFAAGRVDWSIARFIKN